MISLIAASALGFVGTTISSALLFVADQNKDNLALLITSISGTVFSAIGAIGWDCYAKYKDEHDDAQKKLHEQQLHMTDLASLLFHLTQFLNNKKMDKIETFKKCLESLRALPATFNRKIDESTREELISSMIEFLHADHPLVAQINEVCQMAEDLKRTSKEESKDAIKDKTPPSAKAQTAPQAHTESKDHEQITNVVEQADARNRPVMWHGDLDLNQPIRQPVGVGHDSDSFISRLGLGSEKSKEAKFKEAYQNLIDTLNIGHLRYFKYRGKLAESPLKPSDFILNFTKPSQADYSPKKWQWRNIRQLVSRS